MFKREVDALKTLNSCNGIVKIRDYVLNAEFDGKNDCGLILLDYVDGTNLEEVELNQFSQIDVYKRQIIKNSIMCVESPKWSTNTIIHLKRLFRAILPTIYHITI